jgi:hypothetical protein
VNLGRSKTRLANSSIFSDPTIFFLPVSNEPAHHSIEVPRERGAGFTSLPRSFLQQFQNSVLLLAMILSQASNAEMNSSPGSWTRPFYQEKAPNP